MKTGMKKGDTVIFTEHFADSIYKNRRGIIIQVLPKSYTVQVDSGPLVQVNMTCHDPPRIRLLNGIERALDIAISISDKQKK